MFEKFTEGAIKVIMLSQEEARRMGHNFVGTEQLLLGVIGQRHGVGGRALSQLNVTLKKTRKAIEKYIGRGTGFVASEIPFTPRPKRVLETSIHEGQDLGVNYVGTEHILLSLINEVDGVAMRTLDKLGVNIPKLRHLILTYIEEQQEEVLSPPLTDQEKWAVARDKTVSKTPSLDEYTEDLTKLAEDKELDPVIGRAEEIDGLLKVLGRRRKNNPVLLGEAGVGKTACAEGLAQIIVGDQCPLFLYHSSVLVLDLGAVLAGTKYRGEFEDRMKRILQEVKEKGNITLVIDEIHTLVGAGAAEGAVDAANLLKPALARGSLRVIGATTISEYRRYIEKDPALERRFQPIVVDEPSVETTIEILKALRLDLELHHALEYQETALEQAAILSARFITDRNLPDKAIDVADEAGSRVRLQNRKLPPSVQKLLKELYDTLGDKAEAVKMNNFVLAKELVTHEMEVRTHIRVMKFAMQARAAYKKDLREEMDTVIEQDVAHVIARWSGVPVTKINQNEAERLLKMEDHLHERLIGQHKAIVAISKAVRRARAGLGDPKRPIASFIFAGPTGVGKTELTKALAEYMFNSEENLIRFDMSEFMEKHTVAKLIGSPPGYVGFQDGGQLTEAVRLKPYSIVLFDEVEKAHPDVFNIFLQILDDGHVSDSSGRLVNFKNSMIIMTTNLGAKFIEQYSPFLPPEGLTIKEMEHIVTISTNSDGTTAVLPPEEPELNQEQEDNLKIIEEKVQGELKLFFRPEFLNRLDDIIIFSHLTKNNIWDICGLILGQLKKRLSEKRITLVVDNAVQYYLAIQGYDPIYGARPLRRAITRILEDRLANECLNQEFMPDTILTVTLEQQKNAHLSEYSTCNFMDFFTDNIKVEVDTSACKAEDLVLQKQRSEWEKQKANKTA